MTVAFTGHRDVSDEAGVYEQLLSTLRELIQKGAKNFICGGAIGFDTLAAQAVLELKQEFPVRLCLAIPHEGQDARFTPAQQAEYARIRALADRETVLFAHYTRGCMHQRNRFMVDRCDLLVAYCRRPTGGSAYTLDYAEKQGKPIIRL